MIKSFILDTNVIAHSERGNAIFGFDDNNVIITGTTMQELDRKKTDPDIGYNVRGAIHVLDDLRGKGDLTKGVKIGKGELKIIPNGIDAGNLPKGFSLDNPDNRIISTSIWLAKRFPRSHFVLVTNDVSMRVNADVAFRHAEVDIKIQEYKNDHVELDDDYKGYEIFENVEAEIMNDLFSNDEVKVPEAYSGLLEKEFAILKNEASSVLAIREGDYFVRVKDQRCYGLKKTYNAAQAMALYALLAPVSEIPLVILKGPAGTGKTLLAMAAGLDGVRKTNSYDTLLIGRSNVTQRTEEKLGALPGTLEEKLDPIVAPFKDAFARLLKNESKELKKDSAGKTAVKKKVEELMISSVEICPISYIRGRSIPGTFMCLDEAQNTSPLAVRDIMSRAGDDTKVVILGDTSQIDNPTLDERNCGLTAAWTDMRGYAAEIRFENNECVRSALAQEVIKRMKISKK